MSEEEFDPITYAQTECAAAGLTAAQIGDVQAYLVGLFSSYVDLPMPPYITAARWRRYVQLAISETAAPPGRGEDVAVGGGEDG